MGRTLAISDIHGCFEEFGALLELVNYRPEQDRLILLGDYIDRGPQSKEVVEKVMTLHEQWGVVALRGNHEQLMMDALQKDEDARWLKNGALQTIASYCDLSVYSDRLDESHYRAAKQYMKEHFAAHLSFIESLPLYYETDRHIFVHAGINPAAEDWKNQSLRDFIWIRDEFYNCPTELTQTVVFGHTSANRLHESDDIWFGEDKIGIDGGCVYGHQLNCLVLEENGTCSSHFIKRNTGS
ncbi:Serine/threonine-protein phosphatase 1 [Paenibacillus solanacearum]|uniref:Serine/threonine-protein phosphatase 1 n=1 Tax=Paenibacillus solanacearum TaxID=2048548 RepID=A0A916JYE8_9BACL|nr:metallophosphoesterase family protein [Paenibacillus solanacearum]CAG7610681.1 Serine/threonine-protein phosphatase 1 [Paenibacillus solanacearum]